MLVNKIRNHKDNVYLNTVIEPDPFRGALNSPAIYNETLVQDVISNPSEYYCSVIRFSIPLETIPILHFPLDTLQANPNISYLTVGISTTPTGGVLFPQKVIYNPPNNITPPTSFGGTFTNAQATLTYYDIFSFLNFINMFNTALQASVTASGLPVTAPFYIWNPVTQLFSLVVAQNFITANLGIFVDRYALNYVNSFQFFFDSTSAAQNFLFFHILTPTPFGSPVGGPYIYVEDYISVSLWYDLRKLIIKTTTIAVTPENVPTQNPSLNSTSGLVSYSPILTDFVIAFDNSTQAQTVAVYNPSAQYRLVDMTSNSPLNKINLSVFYLDKFGNEFQVYIGPTQQISIKLGFFKKELYKRLTT